MAHKVIGLISSRIDGYYFGSIIKSLEQSTKENGDKLIVFGTLSKFDSCLYALNYIDLWVVVMDKHQEYLLTDIQKTDKPIIGINTWEANDFQIQINNDKLMKDIVHHLHGHGHEKIGFVGNTLTRDGTERYAAYKKYAKNAHHSFFNTSKFELKTIASQINHQINSIDAVICFTDFVAANLMNHLRDLGIKVPDQLAIMSIDDIPAAQSNYHSISTIHISFDRIGEKIMNASETYFSTGDFPKDMAYLDAYPIYRRSCGCEDTTVDNGLQNPIATIEHLNALIERNYHLGQKMQFSDMDSLLSMRWLADTPIRRGVIGLNDKKGLQTSTFEVYDIYDKRPPGKRDFGFIHSEDFPPKELLNDPAFMGRENTLVVIPTSHERKELGAFAFLGTDHISTELMPLNTSFQLADFFGAAYARVKLSHKIKQYSDQLEHVSRIIYDGIFEYNQSTDHVVLRGGINHLFGFKRTSIRFTVDHLLTIIHPEDHLHFLHALTMINKDQKEFNIELRLKTPKAEWLWVELIGQLTYDMNRVLQAVGSVKNITGRKEAQQKINQLAYQDHLTALNNRASLEIFLKKSILKTKSEQKKMALILFDLDRFKNINDTFGHHVGDYVLKAVAERLTPILDKKHFFARLGGDEFVVVISDLHDEQSAYQFGVKIAEIINRPFTYEDNQLLLSTSVGISLYPEHAKSFELLMQTADIAMYTAKNEGRNRVQVFSERLETDNMSRIEMESALRDAIKNNELRLHFQPIYQAHPLVIKKLEVLLRWHSPKLGDIPPNVFIPIAEETGLIVEIGEWVMQEAIRIKHETIDPTGEQVSVFINLSSRQINHPEFIDRLETIFAENNANPAQFGFEITESMVFDNVYHGKKIIESMQELGFRVSMDDFGTGYSSLSMLQQLPVELIKIDKSFIDDVDKTPSKSVILKAIIDMSHALSLEIVIEGIETIEQYNTIKSMGVDLLQGFFFSHPLPEGKLKYILTIKLAK